MRDGTSWSPWRRTATRSPIAVRDHGVGLGPGEEQLVFERFWRADPARARTTGGTGLGLAISLEDARLHGGWLQAWGEKGRGSVFRLTVPESGGAADRGLAAAARAGRGGGRHQRRHPRGRPGGRRSWLGAAVCAAPRAVAFVVALLALLAGCVSMPSGGPVISYPVTQGPGGQSQPCRRSSRSRRGRLVTGADRHGIPGRLRQFRRRAADRTRVPDDQARTAPGTPNWSAVVYSSGPNVGIRRPITGTGSGRGRR